MSLDSNSPQADAPPDTTRSVSPPPTTAPSRPTSPPPITTPISRPASPTPTVTAPTPARPTSPAPASDAPLTNPASSAPTQVADQGIDGARVRSETAFLGSQFTRQTSFSVCAPLLCFHPTFLGCSCAGSHRILWSSCHLFFV